MIYQHRHGLPARTRLHDHTRWAVETPRWYADMPWYAWVGMGLGLALVIGGAW